MKTLRFWFPVAAALSLVNVQPASGIFSYWDVQDGDYGYNLKFSEQFVYGSSADESITLPSAYWNVTLQLDWGGTQIGNTTIVWGDVHAYHLAVASGLGPGLESNPPIPPSFNRAWTSSVGPGNPSSGLQLGVDSWINGLPYGNDSAGGGGTVSYDAQNGIVSIIGSIQLSRTPVPAGTNVPDTVSTVWLAALALGTVVLVEKLHRARQSA